jgi:hypothetical protein
MTDLSNLFLTEFICRFIVALRININCFAKQHLTGFVMGKQCVFLRGCRNLCLVNLSLHIKFQEVKTLFKQLVPSMTNPLNHRGNYIHHLL